MKLDGKASGGVAIHYFGTLRHAAGVARETVAIDGTITLSKVIRTLAEQHGEPLRSSLLDKDGAIRDWLLISVDDEEIDKSGSSPLIAGSEIGIFSPISGG